MKARPSRWNLSPFGSPSYSAPTDTSPVGSILKIRHQGISTTQRFPSRSKDGPSRKVGAVLPWNWVLVQSDRPFGLWNRSGIRAKIRASTDGGAAYKAELLPHILRPTLALGLRAPNREY